ncbi:SRPBCC family protein [Pseudonocardia sp. TRM90224]|uniref:SRPBCC family protein n=1 Tax=Pseudonocardia sp. TRM90224 TaxID=2812678 RepID=UPI001E58CA17|nr:SRPBCC family protein [Pseudonocardia sp. TRM90224]
MQRLGRDEVQRHVVAQPLQVYELVSDVTRTPTWSPQVIDCSWLDGATGPAVGARFVARNKLRWFVWSNRPVVEVADPGREFTICRTEPGGGSIRWAYRLLPEAGGTRVALSYEVLQTVPLGLHIVLRVLFGVRDLQADLHANMVTSLDRIAELATAQRATAPDVP